MKYKYLEVYKMDVKAIKTRDQLIKTVEALRREGKMTRLLAIRLQCIT